jgi:hypothetical protein
VPKRLQHRNVGVPEDRVLADQPDAQLPLGGLDSLDHILPFRQVRRTALKPQKLHQFLADPSFLKKDRNEVDVLDVHVGENTIQRNVAEQGDFLLELVPHRADGPAQEKIGLYADLPQFPDRVLSQLRLEFLGGAELRQERQVHIDGAAGADLHAELSDGLKEREALDVADSAPDLHYHHIRRSVLAILQRTDSVLYLVCYVGNDLYCGAKIGPLALFLDHRLIHLACGHVGALGQIDIDDALVVAQVQISLGAVLGYENLPVLIRTHRAGVDIDVGIDLEDTDAEAAALEESPHARRRQTLPQS